jgi:hypothetical protein
MPLLAFLGLAFFFYNSTVAQNLSFSTPLRYLEGQTTDKAPDITNFKGRFFVIWKNKGNAAAINIACLGSRSATVSSEKIQTVPAAITDGAPVLRVTGDRLYAFWIGTDGSLQYVYNETDSTFNLQAIATVPLQGNARWRGGISCAVSGNNILAVSHAADKNTLVYALLQPGTDGMLQVKVNGIIPQVQSSDYPFVVTNRNDSARIAFKGKDKDQQVYVADYSFAGNNWSAARELSPARSGISPALYHVFNTSQTFYVWRGQKNDDRLFYATANGNDLPADKVELPGYFSTNLPVSLCTVDDRKFILSFVGKDNQLYLSYFTNYNPAKWQEQTLFPAKENYTLKDIVLPGSHDAGMSVLTSTGGINASSINECNVLTQTQDIAAQLKAGLRMFDVRIGVYKDELYTKHASSDCMEEAMGGGYGERFKEVLKGLRSFLQENNKEFVLLTFSHFCEKEYPVKDVAQYIYDNLGKDLVCRTANRSIGSIPIKELAGKAIITFEHYSFPDMHVDSSAMQAAPSNAFLNIRREYAATNNLDLLLKKELAFFDELGRQAPRANELVRLDWQLTQSSDEAAMVCNDFQNEKTNPLVNGAMLLTNVLRKHLSIRDLALKGNKVLPARLNEWIAAGNINRSNKPNILYVDVAGAWITDYCIELNNTALYTAP